VGFLRQVEGFICMFHCLLGVLVSRLVVFFAVMHSGGPVRMCGQVVEFSSSLVCIVRHLNRLWFGFALLGWQFQDCRDPGTHCDSSRIAEGFRWRCLHSSWAS
jgi:hypothetical protein